MKKTISKPFAHALALLTAIIWGTSFIASKLLLQSYTPTQVMFFRFVLAYAALWLLCPRTLKVSFREEMRFAAVAVSGCSLYFLCENSALTYTYAANVSIIVAAAPILTAILAHFTLPDEKLHKGIFSGFAIAIIGVALVVFNGTVILKLSPLGDLLSFGAAACWAVYSVLLKECVEHYDNLLLTRRVMLWGIISSLPIILIEGAPMPLAPLMSGSYLFCILFLGLVCSAVGYIFWNAATKGLGAVVTANYVYVIPFFTMLAGVIALDEPLSPMGVIGAVLILVGLFLSDRKKGSAGP